MDSKVNIANFSLKSSPKQVLFCRRDCHRARDTEKRDCTASGQVATKIEIRFRHNFIGQRFRHCRCSQVHQRENQDWRLSHLMRSCHKCRLLSSPQHVQEERRLSCVTFHQWIFGSWCSFLSHPWAKDEAETGTWFGWNKPGERSTFVFSVNKWLWGEHDIASSSPSVAWENCHSQWPRRCSCLPH